MGSASAADVRIAAVDPVANPNVAITLTVSTYAVRTTVVLTPVSAEPAG